MTKVINTTLAQDLAASTFADTLLASTSYITMCEKMPAIATKLESLDKTLVIKTGEITLMALAFITQWHELSTGGYALDRDEVREYIYSAAKRTGTKKEVTSKIGMATGSFANKTTQASRDAMLAYRAVNGASLDTDGHLVAPKNIMRPLIDVVVEEADQNGDMVKITYKDQENTDASLDPVPEPKARIWAAAAGIVKKTGSKAGAGAADVQTLQQVRDAVRLICSGNPLDRNLAEQDMILEMLADLQGAADQIKCANENGEVDQVLLADISAKRDAISAELAN